MQRIKKLPAHVANKINAGEVITEPVNVVKELLENALDAGSTEITLEIREAGLRSILVIDNGSGIYAEDAGLLFERHATSKLSEARDLYSIESFGFRGEALASIAAISKVNVYSRNQEQLQGFHVTQYGQNLLATERISRDKGTRILVEDLFFNTPVRANFLARASILEKHISEFLQAIAIAHPSVSFRYLSDDRLIFQTKGDGDPLKAIFQIFGKELTEHLLPIEGSLGKGSVKGFLSDLQYSKPTRSVQYIFINGRFVSLSPFLKSLSDAYEGLLMLRRFPVCFLWVDLPFESVDVNIHPKKLEVRLKEEEALAKELSSSLRRALQTKKLHYRIESPIFTKPEPKTYEPLDLNEVIVEQMKESQTLEYETAIQPVLDRKEEFIQPNFLHDLRYIGQLFQSYLLYEQGDRCYVMDQHAAHEKILYEGYLKAYREKQLEMQILLIPFTVELSPDQLKHSSVEELEHLGFEAEHFSEKKLVIRAIPHIFSELQARSFLERYFSAEADDTTGIITSACKAAIKAGDILHEEEQKALLEQLEGLHDPFTCPHGRPIFLEISRREVEKRFERL